MAVEKIILEKINEIRNDNKKALQIREDQKIFYRLAHEFDDNSFVLDYSRLDSLSCEVLQIKVHKASLAGSDEQPEMWDKISNELCSRISYLSEEFRVIELDRVHGVAQIRSYPPYAQNAHRVFFELTVDFRKKDMVLQRIDRDLKSNLAANSPFVLSDEILSRLIADLVA